jgi:hypothetical protein
MKTGLVRTESKVKESQFDQWEQEEAEGYNNTCITSCVSGATSLQFRHAVVFYIFSCGSFLTFC